MIYIVSYLQTNLEELETKKGKEKFRKLRNLDKKNVAKKMLQEAKEKLIENGIEISRIKTLDGGYVDDWRKLEIWFVPKGGEIPKPKPDYFPKKNIYKKK